MQFLTKALPAAAVLSLLWLGELSVPFYAHFKGGWRERLRHDARNLALGLANSALAAILFSTLFLLLDACAESRRFGLLRLVDWPGWVEVLLALVIFDLWMYLWHRANHAVPFLWRFHRMHHSDPAVDASTGLRFHTGEVCLSAVARLAVVPALGMSLRELTLYEAVFLPVVLFHHSNVRLPRWLDHGLLALVVTPAMHRVHHSRLPAETDSNFGSVLPCWDMLLSSFRLRGDARAIPLGLDGLDARDWQTLPGLLKTPLARVPLPADPSGH